MGNQPPLARRLRLPALQRKSSYLRNLTKGNQERWTSQTMESAINESLPNKFSPRNLQRFQTRKGFRSHMLKNKLMISAELHPMKVTCGSIIYYIFRVCVAKIAMFRPYELLCHLGNPSPLLSPTLNDRAWLSNTPEKISPWKLRIHFWKRKHHLPNIFL